MSTQLIILILQEITSQAPTIIKAFENGEISLEQQKALFNEIDKLSLLFQGKEWVKD